MSEKTYLLSYDYAGAQWGIEVMADNMEDAQRRVWAMKSSLKLDGESVLKIKVAPNWLERMFRRLKDEP